LEQLVEQLSRALAVAAPKRPVLLAGDINCRLHGVSSARAKVAIDILQEHGLWICSDPDFPVYYVGCTQGEAPHRAGASVVDIFAYSGSKEQVTFRGYAQRAALRTIKKHTPVYVEVHCAPVPSPNRSRQRRRKTVDIDVLAWPLLIKHPLEMEQMPAAQLHATLTSLIHGATPQNICAVV